MRKAAQPTRHLKCDLSLKRALANASYARGIVLGKRWRSAQIVKDASARNTDNKKKHVSSAENSTTPTVKSSKLLAKEGDGVTSSSEQPLSTATTMALLPTAPRPLLRNISNVSTVDTNDMNAAMDTMNNTIGMNTTDDTNTANGTNDTASMDAIVRENSQLRKDIDFQMHRSNLKMSHIMHLRQGMGHELKGVLRVFYNSHKENLKTYVNWKEGLDVVFRLNRAVILKTRKGGSILVTASQGVGGYGRVAKGYHMNLNCEKVVIKEFLGFEDKRNKLQYLGELQTLKELCSDKCGEPLPYDFIPHYIDRKEERGSYFIMSAWAGNDISRLDAYQKRYLLGHIGSSLVIILRAVHKKGFLHRDVKPENICVDEVDTVRLIDVGSMVRLNDDGRTVTNQPYYDYQHCSINMHKAHGKRCACEMSTFDDIWMLLFSFLRILNMVPRYWEQQSKREDIMSDKKRIVDDPDKYFDGSGQGTNAKALAIMKRCICYVRDSTANTFDYDHLARMLSQL